MSTTYPNLVQTTFPDEIDKKYNMMDVSAANISRVQTYESLISSGNVSGASQYLQNNPDLIPVCFNADKWNRHEQMIIALETFFKDEVHDYILNVAQYKGTYDSSKIYSKYNVVDHTSGGVKQYYMAIQRVPADIAYSPTGQSGSEYWVQLTVKGDRGASGIGLSYVGLWDQTVSYSADDCVSRGKSLWRSLINSNTGNDPSTDNGTKWEQVFEVSTYANAVKFSDETTLQAWRNSVDTELSGDTSNISDLKNNNLIVYISNNGSNSNDGLTDTTPFLNLSGVTSKYRNIKQITIKFLDGTYTDHYLINAFQSVTITSNSGTRSDVILTGGLECTNSTVNIVGITIDGSSYDGAAISLKRVIGTISDCSIIGSNNHSCVKTFVSRALIESCFMTNSSYAVRAEDMSDIIVKNCYGSGISTAYYSLNGSTIDYDDTNEITFTNVSNTNSGIVKANGITPIQNGGTSAANVLDAKINLEATYRIIKSPIGANNSVVSLTTEQAETINHFSVFSIVIAKTVNGVTINYPLLGVRLGGNILYFNGYCNGYLFDAVLSISSGTISTVLHAYSATFAQTDVADAEGFTIVHLNGHI